MKKDLLILGIVVVTAASVFAFCYKKREKEEVEPEPEVVKDPETPDELITVIVKELLKDGNWKNERAFFTLLTKNFIERAPSVDEWFESFPICQEELSKKLEKLGLLEKYEKELEKKYKKS